MDLFTATLQLILIIAAAFGLLYIVATVLNAVGRGSALEDKIRAEAMLTEANAGHIHAKAARVIQAPGRDLFVDGRMYDGLPYIELPPSAPPTPELSRDEINLRGYAMNLIEQSIAKWTGDGTQIIPEDKATGIGHYFWKQATDYMVSKRWIVKDGTRPTVCNGTITLSVIKSALAPLPQS